MGSCTTRLMNILRTRPGRNTFWRGLPIAATCLSKCARLRSNPSRLATANSHSPSLVRQRQNWIQDKFNFFKMHIRLKGLSKSSVFQCTAQGASAYPLPQQTSPELRLTLIVRRSACDQTPQYSLQLQAPAQFTSILQSTRRSWTSLHKLKPCCHHFSGQQLSVTTWHLRWRP